MTKTKHVPHSRHIKKKIKTMIETMYKMGGNDEATTLLLPTDF